jgi:hypothetical protein
MKRFKNKLSNVFYTALCVVFLTSCNQENNEPIFYTWQTRLEVRYSDNTKDTILNTIELHKKYKPYFKIKTKENGLFADTKLVPCLTVSEASYRKGENLACDVRTFRILTQTKHP